MDSQDKLKLKAIKGFVRSSFTIIGIFTVLSYSFAALVLFRGIENLGNSTYAITLFYTLIALPALCFFIHFCSVKRYYGKLCGTSGIRSEIRSGKSHGITVETASNVAELLKLLERDSDYIALICAEKSSWIDTCEKCFFLIRLKK